MIGRVYRWVHGLPGVARSPYWRVLAHGKPFDRGPRRNVLLEQLLPVPVGVSGMVDGELGPLRVIDGFCYVTTGGAAVPRAEEGRSMTQPGESSIGAPAHLLRDHPNYARCDSCENLGAERQVCPASYRDCGHHCNHSWSHDRCCWCGEEWGEQ
jgi:hypothetical protein